MKHLVLNLTMPAISCGVSPAVWAACGTTHRHNLKEYVVNRIAPICLLAMAYMASEPTWAACSDSKVDVALVTTVTVIAGPYDTCIWTDNNEGNSRTLSVAGVVVPNLLQPSNVEFLAYSTVLTATNQTDLYEAECKTTGLVCSEWGLDTPNFGMPRARACVVYNRAAALTATATCVFERPAL